MVYFVDGGVYTCGVTACDVKLTTLEDLDRHRQTHAGLAHPFVCGFSRCNKHYATKKQRSAHHR